MKTKAVRIYGKQDLRLETFDLPAIENDEILMKIVCDSVCMSTHKETNIGEEHWLVNNDIFTNPSIVGHEFAGVLVEVGGKWADKYEEGSSFTVQVALKDLSAGIAGYSMAHCGGSATHVILHRAFMEQENLLPFDSKFGFYSASMAEPISCSVHAFRSMYHTTRGSYQHLMGIVEGGNCAMFAGCGPMGMGGIAYLLNCDRRPGCLVVTDISSERLERVSRIFSPEYAKVRGVDIQFVNTALESDPAQVLLDLTDGKGFDDISVYAPVKEVVELADSLLGRDGCLNFFSGPTDKQMKAEMNFYNVHYNSTHVVGTSGSTTEDMREFLDILSAGELDPAFMITHIGGIDAVVDTVLNLPDIPGSKKLIYPHLTLELTAIEDFAEKGKVDPVFAELAEIVSSNNGLWCVEAEAYLLEKMAS